MRQLLVSHMPDECGSLFITGKDYRYLKSVLRIKIGDMIFCRLPDGHLQEATVASVNETMHEIILNSCTCIQMQKNDFVEYWLFQFIAKPQKMDLIIRQAVECGVCKIIPVISQYSQKYNDNSGTVRADRWARIVREARQQSGSPVETEIMNPVSLSEALLLWNNRASKNNIDEYGIGIVLYEQQPDTLLLHQVLLDSLKKNKNIGPAIVALVVGSEGGISSQELMMLKESAFFPVHLKTNILRCETASLYGVAAIQNAVTEVSVWHCNE